MNLIMWAIDFYKNNEKLAIALISLLGGALLTQVFPKLLASISKFLDYIGQKMGGVLAYKVYEGKYLNWVVAQNQELNLTGMIGTGEKPMLEEVFISLRLSDRKQNSDEQEQNNKNEQLSFTESIQKGVVSITKKFVDLFRIIVPAPIQQTLSIFQARRFWKVRLIFERDNSNKLNYWMVTIPFIFLPVFYLLSLSVQHQTIGSFLSSLILSFFAAITIVLAITGTREEKNIDFWLQGFLGWFIFPSGVLFYVIKNGIDTNQDIRNIVLGIVCGISIVFLIFLIQELNKGEKKNNANVKNVGKFLLLGDNLAILGKPGSGKSTYLQFVALAFARNKAGDRKLKNKKFVKRNLGFNQWYLPILIPLRRVASHIYNEVNKSAGSNSNALFDAFRQKVLPTELQDGFSDEYIRYMLKRKKVVFLFDGLDEVAGDAEFEVLVNEIKGIVSTYSGNKYIISSRYSGWRGGIGAQFTETEIADLDNQQIDAFIESWYKAIEVNRLPASSKDIDSKKKFREDKARERGNSLKQTLRSVESIQNLATNPLLLSLICFVHYNKTLPKERLSLYQDCSKLLLEQWEVEKGRTKDDIPLTFSRKEIIMQEIAFAMHSGEISNEGNPREALASKIIRIIEKSLQRFGVEVDQAEDLFSKLVARTGLLIAVEQYKDVYQFSHLTFQEYYSAQHIFSSNLDIIELIKKSKYNKSTYLVSWWREIVLLFNGLKRDPTELVNRLLEKDSDDFVRARLQIAAQCISEAIVKPEIKTEKKLINELFRIRTLQKREIVPAKKYLEIRDFLLKFATSHEYYEYVLRDKVSNVSKGDVSRLVRNFNKYMDTNDSDLKNAICVGYDCLWENHELTRHLKDSEIIELLDANVPSLWLKLTECITKKIPTKELVEQTIEKTANFFIDAIREQRSSIGYYDEGVEWVKKIMQEIRKDVFNEHWKSIKDNLVNALFEIISVPPPYHTKSKMPRNAFLEYAAILLEFLLFLDSEAERSFHRNQLIDVVQKGKANQQVLGILLLSKIYPKDSDVIKIVAEKANAPSLRVRMATLAAFNNFKAESGNFLPFFKSSMQNYNKYKSRYGQFRLRFGEVCFGKGVLGATIEEHLYLSILISLLEENKKIFYETLEGISEKEFDHSLYMWIEALEKILPLLSKKEIDTFFVLSKNISSQKKLDLLVLITESIEKLPIETTLTVCEEISKHKNAKTIMILENIERRGRHTKEIINKLEQKLTDGLYSEASLTFDILIKNKYI